MPQYQGVWTLQQQMQALTSGQWVTDPLFDYTTLLLQGDAGANGAQNNVFYDTSPNQFAITRNGNTTQGTFSPFSATGWSNYFNGSSYLNIGTTRFLDVSAWTVEMWVNTTSTANFVTLAAQYVASGGGFAQRTVLGINSSSGTVSIFQGGTAQNGTTNVADGRWHHIAFVLNAGTVRAYVDGINEATFSGFGSPTAVTTTFFYDSANASSYFLGYASNLRVTNTAVYTANFTVATSPFTAITGTQLLTCQSNRFVDNSTNAFAVTVNGSPSVQAFSPFAPQFQYTASGRGGSGYFDGSGDYLTTNNINLAANAFTIEGWFYVTTTAGNMNYWGMTNGGGSTPKAVLYMDNVGNLVFETGAVSGAVISVSISTYVKRNAWQHIAISRSGTGASQTAMFIDGVRVGTGTCASLSGITAGFNIGYVGEGFGVTFNGYIAGFRIVNGTAVYNPASTTVTIPTAPLTAVTNTALLTNFTNAGILDGTMKNNLETVGNAQVSTSVVKYGSGSMYFDGTGDWLLMPSNPMFAFPGQFTVEFWLYRGATQTNFPAVFCVTSGLFVGFDTTNSTFGVAQQGVSSITPAAAYPAANTWVHIAVTRDASNLIRIFYNGVQQASGTIATSYAAGITYVGKQPSYGDYNGYIDDLRITQGIARYTQNFIPPSVALPRQ